MSTRLPAGRPDCRTTDHSVEIARMRRTAEDIKATYDNDHTAPPRARYLEVRILECAADLLEVHDATGISLDNWDAPRKLVQDALLIIHASNDDFLTNGVLIVDPNEALHNLRTAAKLIDAHNNGIYVREDDLANACNDMAEAFLALDEWLTKGGFKPSAWETTVVLNAERQFAERDFDRHADEAVALGNGGTLPTD